MSLNCDDYEFLIGDLNLCSKFSAFRFRDDCSKSLLLALTLWVCSLRREFRLRIRSNCCLSMSRLSERTGLAKKLVAALATG